MMALLATAAADAQAFLALSETYQQREARNKTNRGRLVFTERVDLSAAKYIAMMTSEDFEIHARAKAEKEICERGGHSTKEKVEEELERMQRKMQEVAFEHLKNEGVQRTYYFARGKACGRRFATNGLGGVHGAFRSLLCKTKMTDFDMVNCHPRILLWVCDKLGIACEKLRTYVNDRDDILQAMMDKTKKDRKECKEAFLASTNDSKTHRSGCA